MLTRRDIVKKLLENDDDSTIIVASTGYISRTVYEIKDRPLNFYMMGSMGAALGIGIGLALKVPNDVIVINGDGACLMSYGTTATFKKLNLPNLYHVIINNDCHESTGGQETAFRFSGITEDSHTFIFNVGKDDHIPARIPMDPKEITERFMDAVKNLHKQDK